MNQVGGGEEGKGGGVSGGVQGGERLAGALAERRWTNTALSGRKGGERKKRSCWRRPCCKEREGGKKLVFRGGSFS